MKKNFFLKQDWLIFFCMVGIAFVVTGQFLFLSEISITPANDMARHVAIAENFFTALRSGQILPRFQEMSSYGLRDIPLFQYYGFMTGLVAFPGMLLGISALKSLMIGVLLFRIAALVGVYWSAKLLGGNRAVSLLAALVYLMTPYIISNLYGRSAIPETLAHCELPFLVLGLLFGLRGFLARGVTVIAVTVLLLALTHPIFLLYGCGVLVLMIVVSFSRNIIITGFSGLIIGILLSAFQWYPAMMTQELLALGPMAWSPDIMSSFTSARGLFSFPISVLSELPASFSHKISGFPFDLSSPQFQSDVKQLYLTPGWFTLPVLLGLIIQLRHREKRTEKLMILIPAFVFLCFSFGWFDIYQFLPRIAWAVQFPYRLLAFVALFTALALPILLPRLNKVGFVILALLAIGQSTVLLLKPTYSIPLKIDAKTIASVHALTDYAIFDKKKRIHIVEIEEDGWLKDPSVISWPAQQKPVDLWLMGSSIFADRTIELWIADPARPKVPLTGKVEVPPGASTVHLPLPKKPGNYILVPSRVLIPAQETSSSSLDQRRLSLNIHAAEVVPRGELFLPLILTTAIERKTIGPYSRQFQVKREAWWTKEGKTDQSGAVELPIAYSPFFIFTQGKHVLAARPDYRGSTIITTNDLTQPIKARYRLPLICYIAPFIGLLLLFGFARSRWCRA